MSQLLSNYIIAYFFLYAYTLPTVVGLINMVNFDLLSSPFSPPSSPPSIFIFSFQKITHTYTKQTKQFLFTNLMVEDEVLITLKLLIINYGGLIARTHMGLHILCVPILSFPRFFPSSLPYLFLIIILLLVDHMYWIHFP